jgi:hypothetical protein
MKQLQSRSEPVSTPLCKAASPHRHPRAAVAHDTKMIGNLGITSYFSLLFYLFIYLWFI